MKLIRVKTDAEMAARAADLLLAQVLMKEDCVLGLATGSTPLGVYALMAQKYREGGVSFRNVTTVNLDEYQGLSASSPASYRYYMNDNLFRHIDIKMENTHLPDGCAPDADAECARYTALIDALGGIDLQLLGIGMNGHIGFNEPADSFPMDTHCVALTKSTLEANAVYFEGGLDSMPTAAFTMGMRAIMQARRVVLVAGANKNDILLKALYGPVTPQVPASILQLHSDVTIICQLEE